VLVKGSKSTVSFSCLLGDDRVSRGRPSERSIGSFLSLLEGY
jgi:hypothetical protein